MKFVKPSFRIEWGVKNITKKIERAARNCYKSENLICQGSDLKLIDGLIARRHFAMLEFGDICVSSVTDRGISHELVRHRIASYAHESTRWCNYAKDKFNNEITYILPKRYYDFIEINEDGTYQFLSNLEPIDDNKIRAFYLWYEGCRRTEELYLAEIALGESPSEARDNLPNCLKTEIFMKCNVTEWRHVFWERAINKQAHQHMRQLMIPLLLKFSILMPNLFEDLLDKRDGVGDFAGKYWAEDKSIYDLDNRLIEVGDE